MSVLRHYLASIFQKTTYFPLNNYHLLLKLKRFYRNGYGLIIISTIMHFHIYYVAIYPYVDDIKAVISVKVYIYYAINFRKPIESYRQVEILIWCQTYSIGFRCYINSILFFVVVITELFLANSYH